MPRLITARPHLSAFIASVLVILTVAAYVVLRPATPANAAVPASLRVLLIGESLAQGYGSTDGCGVRTEVDRLANLNGTSIVWTGPPNGGNPYQPGIDCPTGWRGGATIDVLTSGISGWLASDHPDAVVIFIGTNNASGAGTGVPNFGTYYTSLIQTILNSSPTVHVYPMMILYSSASWAKNEVDINIGIINAFWNFCSGCPAGPNAGRVTLIDPSGYPVRRMDDGIHPNDYTPIADQLFRGMAPAYSWKVPYGTTVMTGGSCRPGYERQPLQWTCPE